MAATFKQLTDFLLGIGIESVPHTKKTYLGHLIAVHSDLKSWGCNEEVCRAGMFHSIYGTERFQGFTLPVERRAELVNLIGERAERLAYWNCCMDRATFDQCVPTSGPYEIRDRITGDDVQLSEEDFNDLCWVHLCDWLEQVPRCQIWDYRRAAYRGLAERLGGVAIAAYERVFAEEISPAT